jgi:hypothetical protein
MRRVKRTTVLVLAFCALLATNAALLASGSTRALPGALANYFFGPNMLRSVVVVKDRGGIHEWRLDRGRIRALTPTSLTLLERDGTLVTVPIAPTTRVTLNGRPAPVTALRRGMRALTARDGDLPAEVVQAAR